LGIYWNNHHHLLKTVRGVRASMMWANLHLLFWLSLIPFVTGWMGNHHTQTWPVALYGIVLLMAACAYSLLQETLVRHHGKDSPLAKVLGRDIKGKLSVGLYALSIFSAFSYVWLSFACFIIVAVMWIIPDKRIAEYISKSK
jgi:uncharacterized membrane protein